jgi:hypothetical protein
MPVPLPMDQAAAAELTRTVARMTEKRMRSSARYKVYSPKGDKAITLFNMTDGAMSYGYQRPGRYEKRVVKDPKGIATAIINAFWLSEDAFVLVCAASGGLAYYDVEGAARGWETGYQPDTGKNVIP